MSTIILDTETTGLVPGDDEILQLSIINDKCEPLWNRYYKPVNRTEWPEAEAVNSISPAMVSDKPPISADHEAIQAILNSATEIIGYNTSFDLAMLSGEGFDIPNCTIYDVMRDFAPVYGEYSPYHGDFKWQKLYTCYDYCCINSPELADNELFSDISFHNSLDDCRATLFCYLCLQDPKYAELEVENRKDAEIEDADFYINGSFF